MDAERVTFVERTTPISSRRLVPSVFAGLPASDIPRGDDRDDEEEDDSVLERKQEVWEASRLLGSR